MNGIRLNPTLDAAAIRDSSAAIGRVHVPDVLVADSARAIHRALADSNSWQLSLNSSDRHVDLPTEQLELLPSAAQVLLVDAVNRSARTFHSIHLQQHPAPRSAPGRTAERPGTGAGVRDGPSANHTGAPRPPW